MTIERMGVAGALACRFEHAGRRYSAQVDKILGGGTGCTICPENGFDELYSFNAARSIVCVETLCPAALVPRGLRRHFGKTRFFAPFLASADELCPEKWGSHRRCPLCGAGCTVLERRNGGMRLYARAGALSISFSSYLMIAHASFFFNDVFASMQRGR